MKPLSAELSSFIQRFILLSHEGSGLDMNAIPSRLFVFGMDSKKGTGQKDMNPGRRLCD